MTEPVYAVKWTPTASRLLDEISDKRIQRVILERTDKLSQAPEEQGKALVGELTGYRRITVEHERYRIIYHVRRETVIVVIVAVGLRKHGDAKDIYALARKLLRQGLIQGRTRRARK